MGKNSWKEEQGESWRSAATHKLLPEEEGHLHLPAAAHTVAWWAEKPLLRADCLVVELRLSQIGSLWVLSPSTGEAELPSATLG